MTPAQNNVLVTSQRMKGVNKMKVRDLFAVTSGPVMWSISETEELLWGVNFWNKYRRNENVWDAYIDFVHFIPKDGYTIILITIANLNAHQTR